MGASSASLHAPRERLSPETLNLHHAIVSLMEELEAIDWYDQRIEAATDEELREILRHNRDEEKEHAAIFSAGSCSISLDMIYLCVGSSGEIGADWNPGSIKRRNPRIVPGHGTFNAQHCSNLCVRAVRLA